MAWPRVKVLGVNVDDLALDALLDLIEQVVRSQSRAVFANVNIHALNLAHEFGWLREFFNRSELVYCDGEGVRLGAWLAGQRLRYRHTPTDWLPHLCQRAQVAGHSMYLLGSREPVVERAAERLRREYPELRIAGVHHGYFNHAAGSRDNERILEHINRGQPDILFVALGMPLQEAWIRDHRDRLAVHAIVPVGALFDYVSGRLVRPPKWLRDYGFEWLGRLKSEPRRLWRRYLLGNPLFVARVIRHRIVGGSG